MVHFFTFQRTLERGSFYFFAVFFPLTPPSLPLVYPPTPCNQIRPEKLYI